MSEMLELDGVRGEGGGQILRTALALSMCTGRPFHIRKIRAGRARPGLMRQHLEAVYLAARISSAELQYDALGSSNLIFRPGRVVGGSFKATVVGAGSTTLIFQAILPALARAETDSEVEFQGGTHAPAAPTFDHLAKALVPLLSRMGIKTEVTLERPGFFPAGGGRFLAKVSRLSAHESFSLLERGDEVSRRATAYVAHLDPRIGERELTALRRRFSIPKLGGIVRECPESIGPGNALVLEIASTHVTEVFSCIGERGKRADQVGVEVATEAQEYLQSSATVSTHLADQLLVPLAISGGGSFTTFSPSSHFVTNAEVIREFLDITIETTPLGPNLFRVDVGRASGLTFPG